MRLARKSSPPWLAALDWRVWRRRRFASGHDYADECEALERPQRDLRQASCTWRLDAGELRIAPAPAGKVTTLPPHLSLELHGATSREVLRALATALGVGISHRQEMPNSEAMNLNFVNAPTSLVLDALCKTQNCDWSFDGTGTEGFAVYARSHSGRVGR